MAIRISSSYYATPQQSKYRRSDIDSEFRDLKLKIISGDYQFSFMKHKADILGEELEFIAEKFPNDIITGSIALKLYGLLDRNTSDIDILIKDKDRYDSYTKDFYGHYKNDNDIDTRLGYKNISYKKGFFSKKRTYTVDFFEDKGVLFNTLDFNGVQLKIHNPMELITTKINLSINNKHFDDLIFAFKSINLEI
jgi:hypothetical protein